MACESYSAMRLFEEVTSGKDILVLDVRNTEDFGRFKIESPRPFSMVNIPYFDFMEAEEDACKQIPQDKPIRVVCAKEGSARYVCEILEKRGFNVLGYLEGGIKSWGNLLVPKEIYRDSDFLLYQFIRPGKASCSYALIHKDEVMFFDPSRNVDFYLSFAKEHGCRVTLTFETHLQADYIAGSRLISEKTGAVFVANENDFREAKFTYHKVKDGEIFGFNGADNVVKAIHTPGHTPGSTTYLILNKFLITGDTVFIYSIGRPDLGGKADEWSKLLFDTLNLVKSWDKDLYVLPGHYMDWSEANSDLTFMRKLGEVIELNKDIFEIKTFAEFLQFIKDNMRPQPEEYAKIRLVNANLLQVSDEEAEILDLGKNECAATQYARMKMEKQA